MEMRRLPNLERFEFSAFRLVVVRTLWAALSGHETLSGCKMYLARSLAPTENRSTYFAIGLLGGSCFVNFLYINRAMCNFRGEHGTAFAGAIKNPNGAVLEIKGVVQGGRRWDILTVQLAGCFPMQYLHSARHHLEQRELSPQYLQ